MTNYDFGTGLSFEPRKNGKGGPDASFRDIGYYGRCDKTGHAWPMPIGFAIGKAGKPPLCGHGLVASLYYTTQTTGQKGGRPFLRCPKGKDDPDDCHYFYWVDEIP